MANLALTYVLVFSAYFFSMRCNRTHLGMA